MALIKYRIDGSKESFRRLLREFKLDVLLKEINKLSADLFLNTNKYEGAKSFSYQLFRTDLRKIVNQETFISGWNLIDLAYSAIMETNDFIGKTIESEDEIGLLLSALETTHEKKNKEVLNAIRGHYAETLIHIFGFFGEQAKIQTISNSFDNAARDLYILLEISKKIKLDKQIDAIIREETSLEWDALVSNLLLAWFFSLCDSEIFSHCDLVEWDELLKYDDYVKTIERYTSTYKEIRNSRFGRQFLYTKPFIRTQRDEIISISPYLNLFLYEHSIFWIVRNYYLKKDSDRFLIDFGKIFEEYFHEVMSNCLSSNQFARIKEGSNKRADWEIHLDRYDFLVEQKSTLLGISAKKQDTDINAIKSFAEKSIFRALKQLNSTEKDFNKQFIKIILVYEDYLSPEIFDSFLQLETCPVENDHYYWMMTISEMESLLITYKNNSKIFKKVVKEKIDRELNESKEGKSIGYLLKKNGITRNEYIGDPTISKYLNLAQERITEHLKK